MRFRHVALALATSSIVLLAGCDRKQNLPKDLPHAQRLKMGEVQRNEDTVGKMVAASWTRPAAWHVVMGRTRTDEVPVGTATDRFGSRFLLASMGQGYTVLKVLPDCARGTYAVLDVATAANDEAEPKPAARTAIPKFRLSPDEVKSACTAKGGQRTDIAAALEVLRVSGNNGRDDAMRHAPTYTKLGQPADVPQSGQEKAIAEARRTGRPVTTMQSYPGMPQGPRPN